MKPKKVAPNKSSQGNKDIVDVVRKCSEEIEAVLKKHKCRLTVARQVMFGQQVFVPIVEPAQD